MHTENSKILLTVIKENLSKWKDIPCLFDRNRKSSPQTHVCVLSHFSHVRLCNHIDCSWSGSSVHGILQARILEWVGCPPPGDLPNPGIKPSSHVFCIGRQVLYHQHAWILSRFSHVHFCNPTDCSLPGSSVHGILQAKILEWVPMPFTDPGDPPD